MMKIIRKTIKPFKWYLILIFLVACNSQDNSDESQSSEKEKSYKPTWESLSKYPGVPEWLRDAKFGIYTHWGPITVASEEGGGWAQWYGRHMYQEDNPAFEYHRNICVHGWPW